MTAQTQREEQLLASELDHSERCILCCGPVEDRGQHWECDRCGETRVIWDCEEQAIEVRRFTRYDGTVSYEGHQEAITDY